MEKIRISETGENSVIRSEERKIMSKKMFRRLLSTCCAAAMSAGLAVPAVAETVEPSRRTLPKNEIYFDEPTSQGDLPGSAGSWTTTESNRWQQLTLPIGNSYMGANVYGEVGRERLTFNEKTVWNGGPSPKRPNYNGGNIATTSSGQAMSALYEEVVQAYLNKASNADAIAGGLVGAQDGYGSYQLLGDIYLDFDRGEQSVWEKYESDLAAYMQTYWNSGTQEIDDRDSSIRYTGWSDWAKSGWHNDTEKFTETIGAELNMTFTGKGIRMIGAKNSTCGAMDVYLDGELVLQDQQLSSPSGDGQELFSLTGLENREHTLRIVNKGGGQINKISYDYFVVKKEDTVTQGQTVVDLNPSNSAVTGIEYSSDWANWDRQSGNEADADDWVNHDEMYVNNSSTSTSIRYTFTGTGIALYGAKNGQSGSNMGDFTWSVDGSQPQSVNCVRSEPSIQRMELFSQTGLEEGEHTVVITGAGKKLSFDNFVVYGGQSESGGEPVRPSDYYRTQNYRRWLDLDNALAGVEFDRYNTRYTREYLASFPDKVIAMKIKADGEKKLDFDFSLPFVLTGSNVNGKTATTTVDNDGNLTVTGKMNDNDLKLAARAKVVTDGGTVSGEGDLLEIRNASEATIFVSAATDYENDYPEYRTGETDAQLLERVAGVVDAAAAKGYAKVREDHLSDYKNIYDRVSIDLGQADPEMPTDELLKGYQKNEIPDAKRRYLEMDLYQYGRYLQIASTRAGDKLPANLQGVWNIYAGASGAVPWGSDYHMNVNMQLNYMPTYTGNMAECAIPMIEYEDSLREPGRITASTYFGIDNSNGQQNGYTAHTQNTPFGWTCPGWSFDWGWSPAAVPWMLQNVYEYYEFTGDVDYLENTIFPMMEEQAKLYEQILVDVTYSNGVTRKATVPAYSPEHGPRTAGNTYENALVWQLFNDCIEAADAINAKKPGTVSAEKIATWQNLKDKLKPIEVGSSGQIKEWYDETSLGSVSKFQSGHRHLSHLLGLSPGDLITIKNPDLLEAAAVSLAERGKQSTGWGMAVRINSWARAKKGDESLELIENLFRSGIYNNLWDAHPPFQIDGNFGYTAGVNEMLMQSNAGVIELLPALPSKWAEGSVDGIVARGNFEVSIDWSEGEVRRAQFLSKNGGTCTVHHENIASAVITDENGNTVAVSDYEDIDNSISFETEKGKTYTMTFVEPGEVTVTAAAALADITVPFNTAAADLQLPGSVEVTLSDGTRQTVNVTWDTSNYTANKAGTYTLSGTLASIASVSNPNGVKASVKVIVSPSTAPAIDTSLLEQACRKAGLLDLDAFVEANKAEFETAKAAADAELAAPASQAQVNARARELNSAMHTLRRTPSKAALEAL